jgi:hypothetical protein
MIDAAPHQRALRASREIDHERAVRECDVADGRAERLGARDADRAEHMVEPGHAAVDEEIRLIGRLDGSVSGALQNDRSDATDLYAPGNRTETDECHGER